MRVFTPVTMNVTTPTMLMYALVQVSLQLERTRETHTLSDPL